MYGAEGIWGADVEKGSDPAMWEAFQWNSANMVRHMATFALSEGNRYQALVPDAELVVPHQTHDLNAYTGWAYAARTPKKDYFLIFYERDCPTATVRAAQPSKTYRAEWFDPRQGKWSPVGEKGTLDSDRWGRIAVPKPPTPDDWGLKLVLR